MPINDDAGESRMPVRGLRNAGNFCYVNALMQIFVTIPNMVQEVRNLGGMWRRATELYRGNQKPIYDNPEMQELLENWFEGEESDQQCLHECATRMLDVLDANAGNTAFVMHQYVQRYAAALPSRRIVKIRCMSLYEGTNNLSDSFLKYLEVAYPDPVRAPQLRHSYKLHHSPPVVIFHVQRNNWYGGRLVRSQRVFHYPYTLDGLAGLGARYILRVVATHTGSGVKGHSISAARRGNRWTDYNDGSTRTLTTQEVLGRKNMFICWYTRDNNNSTE